ncbi:MAG: choice-of-anchor tandem repeat GloVer-containing protein [Terriglobales bacterium]
MRCQTSVFLAKALCFSALAVLLPARALTATNYKVLHAFAVKGEDGGGPFAPVVLDAQGNLYGTTWGGGAYGYGTVFELSPSSGGRWIEKVLHSFCAEHGCLDGSLPIAGLTLDPTGNIYGASEEAIFELSPDSDGWRFAVLYRGGCRSNLLLDKAGNLYGPFGRGTGHGGAISELIRGSRWTLKTLYSFCPTIPCVDGDSPDAVIADAAGNLFGTTQLGGKGISGDWGTVFELRHTANHGWKHLLLHSFQAFQGDGEVPYAGLVPDSSGSLYGTTSTGGKYTCYNAGCGTVFKLSRDPQGHWKETILHNFEQGKNGEGVGAGLVFDKAGNLYGATADGGIGACAVGCGVVFKLSPRSDGTWQYSVLHRFTGKDGANPAAALILDKQGNLYGTTTQGGAGGAGVVFQITP